MFFFNANSGEKVTYKVTYKIAVWKGFGGCDLSIKMVEPAGVEPASCNDLMTTYYTLVPFLLFRVLTVSQRTDFAQTASSEISHADR